MDGCIITGNGSERNENGGERGRLAIPTYALQVVDIELRNYLQWAKYTQRMGIVYNRH